MFCCKQKTEDEIEDGRVGSEMCIFFRRRRTKKRVYACVRARVCVGGGGGGAPPPSKLYKTPSKGGTWLVKVKLLKLCRTTRSYPSELLCALVV